jgi:hypothetical protein
MKHLIIIALGLAGLVAFLNYDRIQHYLHPARKRAIQDSMLMPEARRAVAPPVQTIGPVAVMPTSAATNAVPTNSVAAWQSVTAQHYADLIKNIRSTRGN